MWTGSCKLAFKAFAGPWGACDLDFIEAVSCRTDAGTCKVKRVSHSEYCFLFATEWPERISPRQVFTMMQGQWTSAPAPSVLRLALQGFRLVHLPSPVSCEPESQACPVRHSLQQVAFWSKTSKQESFMPTMRLFPMIAHCAKYLAAGRGERCPAQRRLRPRQWPRGSSEKAPGLLCHLSAADQGHSNLRRAHMIVILSC